MLSRSFILLILIISIIVPISSADTIVFTSDMHGNTLDHGPATWPTLYSGTAEHATDSNNPGCDIKDSTGTNWVDYQRGMIGFNTSNMSGSTIDHAVLRSYYQYTQDKHSFSSHAIHYRLMSKSDSDAIDTADHTDNDGQLLLEADFQSDWSNITLTGPFILNSPYTWIIFEFAEDESPVDTGAGWDSHNIISHITGPMYLYIDEDDILPEYDTNLSASGTFCSYNTISFNMSVEPYDSTGYFEIYIYKDSPTSLYSGDTGTDTGWFLFNKTLPSGNYYNQGFFTPDGSEDTYGEWLNFTVMSDSECLIAPNGTISSEYNTTTYGTTVWNVTNIGVPYTWDEPEGVNDTFIHYMWDMGYISDEDYYDYTYYYANATNDPQTKEMINISENYVSFNKDVIGQLESATNATRTNLNVSHGILSQYTLPISTMGTYAIAFIPGPVRDLITAYLIIQSAFLILFMKKD